jgi:hypothetical protein
VAVSCRGRQQRSGKKLRGKRREEENKGYQVIMSSAIFSLSLTMLWFCKKCFKIIRNIWQCEILSTCFSNGEEE